MVIPALFASCSSEPAVGGKFPLTAADVAAIQQLVDARPDIRKPLRDIYVDRPNHAQVSSGTPTHHVGSGSFFTVAKRQGNWMVDSPVQEEHIIVEGQ